MLSPSAMISISPWRSAKWAGRIVKRASVPRTIDTKGSSTDTVHPTQRQGSGRAAARNRPATMPRLTGAMARIADAESPRPDRAPDAEQGDDEDEDRVCHEA